MELDVYYKQYMMKSGYVHTFLRPAMHREDRYNSFITLTL